MFEDRLRQPAVATLTYVYAESTAVLGPLATYAEPHCYDLCAAHGERLTAPRGGRWSGWRATPDSPRRPPTTSWRSRTRSASRPARSRCRWWGAVQAARSEPGRRGHLRVLRATRDRLAGARPGAWP